MESANRSCGRAEPGKSEQRSDSHLIVLLCAKLIFLGCIVSPPSLMDDVDAVHAEIARKMLDSGDWVTPRLDGVAYLEKAPLVYWVMAGFYRLFGVHDWAARIPLALLSRINNFDEFFKRFQRHNLNVGVQVRVPIFSARTSSAVALARTDLNAAELELKSKRSDLEIQVRREARRARELNVGREVARLELQLAQENLRVLQAQFQEGRASLRDLEKARLEESDKWMAFLEADYERQRAQLELL